MASDITASFLFPAILSDNESQASLWDLWINGGLTTRSLPGQQSKQPMASFLHEIFLWKPCFRELQKQLFESSTEFVSSLKLVTPDFCIKQQIGIFSGFLPVRKYLDIDFISQVMEMTQNPALFSLY